MADDLGIGLALEPAPFGDQLVAQVLEVLDDSVVDQRDRPDDVRVGIADGRRAVRRPARVRYSRGAMQGMLGELARQIVELALGAAPFELAALDRADAGRIVAAIFEALQPVEQALRDVRFADDPDDPAHASRISFNRCAREAMPGRANYRGSACRAQCCWPQARRCCWLAGACAPRNRPNSRPGRRPPISTTPATPTPGAGERARSRSRPPRGRTRSGSSASATTRSSSSCC